MTVPDWLKPAVPTIAWCAMIVAGVGFLVFGSPPTRSWPRAARLLPANTLLLYRDLQQPGLDGRYIAAPNGIRQGDTVRPQDVAPSPILPAAPPVRLLLSLPIPYGDIAKGINAASTPQLCGKAPQAFGPVSVAFVHCAQADTACAALVEIPPAAAADLAAKGLKDTATAAELHLATTCQ